MTRVESWSGTRAGTLVTLHRGALSGEKTARTKAWTASGPFYSESGVACIRVDIGGAVVSYPLDRVSLGWDERPAPTTIPLAAVLDPEPEHWTTTGAFFAVMGGCIAVYIAGLVLSGLIDWVAR